MASALTSVFIQPKSEGVLLVDASNPLNELNRQLVLLNMYAEYPTKARFLTNFFRKPAHLFLDGEVLLSQEGTSQGGPHGMLMYAIALLTLIKRLRDLVKQFWYADHPSAGGELEQLESWWKR